MDLQNLLNLLSFLAPKLENLSQESKEIALGIAEKYRPWCLSSELQDEAQVWYAAWLLWNREEQSSGIVYGAKMKKEQSLQIEYGGNGQTDDPNNYLKRYNDLNNLCGMGSILVAGCDCGCDNCAR